MCATGAYLEQKQLCHKNAGTQSYMLHIYIRAGMHTTLANS